MKNGDYKPISCRLFQNIPWGSQVSFIFDITNPSGLVELSGGGQHPLMQLATLLGRHMILNMVDESRPTDFNRCTRSLKTCLPKVSLLSRSLIPLTLAIVRACFESSFGLLSDGLALDESRLEGLLGTSWALGLSHVNFRAWIERPFLVFSTDKVGNVSEFPLIAGESTRFVKLLMSLYCESSSPIFHRKSFTVTVH